MSDNFGYYGPYRLSFGQKKGKMEKAKRNLDEVFTKIKDKDSAEAEYLKATKELLDTMFVVVDELAIQREWDLTFRGA